MRISRHQLNRLRIMYAFDLATRHHRHDWPKIIFQDGSLNAEWIRICDVFNLESFNYTIKGRMKVGEVRDHGCFKVRRTPKGYVIYTELARVKL